MRKADFTDNNAIMLRNINRISRFSTSLKTTTRTKGYRGRQECYFWLRSRELLLVTPMPLVLPKKKRAFEIPIFSFFPRGFSA